MSIYEHFSEEEMALLRARADRVGRLTADDEAENFQTALAVHMCDEVYALPIDSLVAVYEAPLIVPVPCVPRFVAGISNIRGHIVPVLKLGTLLDAADADEAGARPLVVATNEEYSVAFTVSAIGEVLTFSTDDLAPPPGNMSHAQSGYVRGVFSDGMALVDVDTILNDSALIIEEVIE